MWTRGSYLTMLTYVPVCIFTHILRNGLLSPLPSDPVVPKYYFVQLDQVKGERANPGSQVSVSFRHWSLPSQVL